MITGIKKTLAYGLILTVLVLFLLGFELPSPGFPTPPADPFPHANSRSGRAHSLYGPTQRYAAAHFAYFRRFGRRAARIE